MNRFWLGLLVLMWRTFQSTEGARDRCPSPLAVDFAEFFAESYQVGTQVKYKCDQGYKRPSGQGWTIKCNPDRDGFGRWSSVTCVVDPSLSLRPSTQPVTRVGEESGRTDGPLTTAQPFMKGFCRVLKSPKHVKAVSTTYAVGQELQYRCMDGYQARSPISEKSTCQSSNGKTVWSTIHLRCTNDTLPIDEDITPEIGISIGGHSHVSNFAVVFAVTVMATVVI
ncbi:PREDICTED: interleukin-2 receptor subunit alpha-like isoform X2 [Gekko japonicus]|uniref:Interleukin-2 receptor subunit alpha n=1 Tax=Gekko japonicus TaxID=146911 RepID=A0ABM1KX36_GEKJA|nr:PREDICTED: interleukin-2 receptor subunit alpha-like isoform X2 [Gekko japonicus]